MILLHPEEQFAQQFNNLETPYLSRLPFSRLKNPLYFYPIQNSNYTSSQATAYLVGNSDFGRS